MDLVGSLSQSGGIGALLALHDTGTNEAYLPGYDGNGNVAVMIDVATGALKATYEYSPFGQFLRKEGAYAEANPVRFSTKFTDEETGLVYYGRRYYDPKDGRFVGRDPIEEQGGLNLYAFVANGTVNRWDYLGLSWWLEVYQDEAFRGNDNQTDLRSPGKGYGTWSETGVFGPGYYNEDTDVRDIPGFDAAGHDQMKQIIADVNGSQSSFGSSFGGGGAAGYGGLTIPNAPNNAEREKKLNDCYSAARAAHGADTAKLGQIGEARIESFFGSLAAQRSVANWDLTIGITQTVSDTALTVGGSYFVGLGASAGYARAAASTRALYSTARSWQEVNALARVAAQYQTTSNYLQLGAGSAYAVAYHAIRDNLAFGLGGEGLDFAASNRFGQAGLSIGLTRTALDYIAASGLSDAQAAAAVGNTGASLGKTQQTLNGRLDAAISDCDRQFK